MTVQIHRPSGVAFSAGVSTGGNTAGNTTVQAGQVVLAGGNNITLSQATAAGMLATISISGPNAGTAPPIGTAVKGVSSIGSTGTITRFAPEDHQHAGVFSVGVSTGGNTLGNTTVFPGQLVLAGGNNVTLSASTAAGNLMTVTMSGQTAPPIATTVSGVQSANNIGTVTRFAPEDHQHAGLASISVVGNTVGTTTAGAGSLVVAGGPNITLSGSTAAGVMTLSISGGAGAGGNAGTNTLGMSNLGNTAGTTGVVSDTGIRYLFAGGSNITLSQSLNGVSGTLTISAGAVRSFFEINAPPSTPVVSFASLSNRMIVEPFWIYEAGLSAKTVEMLLSRQGGTSLLMTLGIGFYTLNNSTRLSLVSSSTQNYSVTASANYSGVNRFQFTGLSALTLSEGQWFLAVYNSFAATNSGNMGVLGAAALPTIVRYINTGTDQTAAVTASSGLMPFFGGLSMTTAAIPNAIGQSDFLGGQAGTEAGHMWFGIRQL